jgi:hypothetical protein
VQKITSAHRIAPRRPFIALNEGWAACSILDVRRRHHNLSMQTQVSIADRSQGALACAHARQSGALRLDTVQTIVAFAVCDECGTVVRPLPAHSLQACSMISHPALIAAQGMQPAGARAA